MRRYRFLSVFTILTMVLSVTSCFKDEDVLSYGNVSMVSQRDGRFYSDFGSVFNVVDKPASQTPSSKATRLYFNCDVLRPTSGGAENEFDVRLNQFIEALDKDPVRKSQITSVQEEILGDDPITFEKPVFFSGGYLNFFYHMEYKKGSTEPHNINVVYDDLHSNRDTLCFELRHHAKGETVSKLPSSELVLGEGMMSCRIHELIPEGQDAVVIALSCNWYENDRPSAEAKLVNRKIFGKYMRGGFVQE